MSTINKDLLQKDYEKYISLLQTNKHRADFYISKSKTTRNVINYALKSFHIRPEYHSEARYFLLNDYYRALNTYNPNNTNNASLWTWVNRLLIQSAYNFIKDKTKENTKYKDYYSVETTPEVYTFDDNSTPIDEKYISKESSDISNKNIKFILDNILTGPIEVEIYARQYGILSYPKQNTIQIADEMNLTISTVKTLIKRNQNNLYLFKQYLKQNHLTLLNTSYNTITEYASYKRKILLNKQLSFEF